MIRLTLTDAEAATATNALRIAAERFDGYAADAIPSRIAEQFPHQAKASRALADKIDEAEEA